MNSRSYKIDLSELERDGATSLTQQVVDRFAAAIESGQLEPGEKLPPTRELAELVGREPPDRRARVQAARGARLRDRQRRAAARSCARWRPAGSAELGDDWQLYALPEHELTYSEEVLADVMSSGGAGRPPVARDRLAVAEPLPDHRARPHHRRGVRRGGRRGARLPAGGGPVRAARAARRARAHRRLRPGPGRDHRRPRAPSRASASPRARRSSPGDVAIVESPTFAGLLDSLRQTGARVIGVPVDENGFDVGQLERLLARHEVKLVALQTACQNPTGRDLSEERRVRLAELAIERNFFILEDRVYADTSFGHEPTPAASRAGARARDLHQLAVEGRGRRAARRLGGGARAGARADRDAEAREPTSSPRR